MVLFQHSLAHFDVSQQSEELAADRSDGLDRLNRELQSITESRDTLHAQRHGPEGTLSTQRAEIAGLQRQLDTARRTLHHEQEAARAVLDVREREVNAAQAVTTIERERASVAEQKLAGATNVLLNLQHKKGNWTERLSDRTAYVARLQEQIKTNTYVGGRGK